MIFVLLIDLGYPKKHFKFYSGASFIFCTFLELFYIDYRSMKSQIEDKTYFKVSMGNFVSSVKGNFQELSINNLKFSTYSRHF